MCPLIRLTATFFTAFKLIKNSSKRITAVHFAMYANAIRFLCSVRIDRAERAARSGRCLEAKGKRERFLLKQCRHMPRHSFVDFRRRPCEKDISDLRWRDINIPFRVLGTFAFDSALLLPRRLFVKLMSKRYTAQFSIESTVKQISGFEIYINRAELFNLFDFLLSISTFLPLDVVTLSTEY